VDEGSFVVLIVNDGMQYPEEGYFPTQFPAPSFASFSAILAAAFSKAAFRIATTLPRKFLSAKATIGWSEIHLCSIFNFHPLGQGARLSSFALNCQRRFK
jgi:hypothetical protein